MDRHRSSLNWFLVGGLLIASLALYGGDPVFVVLGLAMAGYGWFTTPAHYVVFNDRLMIAYGRPRVRYVLFQHIGQVEVLELPFGNRLRVRLRQGRSLFIQPRDPEEFQGKFQGALETYLRDQGEVSPLQET